LLEDVPIGVKLAVIEGIPLDIWYFFGASFSLGIAGLLARSSWEKRRKYLSLYALFIFIVVIIFAAGSPSLCWRFLLLLPFPLSMTATCFNGEDQSHQHEDKEVFIACCPYSSHFGIPAYQGKHAISGCDSICPQSVQ
jgi:hypothetical protein